MQKLLANKNVILSALRLNKQLVASFSTGSKQVVSDIESTDDLLKQMRFDFNDKGD